MSLVFTAERRPVVLTKTPFRPPGLCLNWYFSYQDIINLPHGNARLSTGFEEFYKNMINREVHVWRASNLLPGQPCQQG